jgi:hypothetical protein
MKKQILLAITLSMAALSATAVELSHSITRTNDFAVRTLNSKTVGDVTSTEVTLTRDRAKYPGVQPGCGSNCGPNVDNYVVGQTLDVRLENTKLDQLTAGTITTVGAACETSVSVGDLAATQGVRTSTSNNDYSTTANNLTHVTSGSVKIETNTNQPYLGNGSSKPGNDVQLSINSGALVVGTEDDSVDFMKAVAVMGKGVTSVDVLGQDLNAADENGIKLTYGSTNLQTTDKSVTKNTGTSTTTTVYSKLN